MPTKTVKLSAEHHRRLKTAGVLNELPLQLYLELLLDWAMSQTPELRRMRTEYFRHINIRIDI